MLDSYACENTWIFVVRKEKQKDQHFQQKMHSLKLQKENPLVDDQHISIIKTNLLAVSLHIILMLSAVHKYILA